MEKGYIYFLYRPKVGAQEAKSFDDVARMYILLKTLPKKADALSEPEEEEIEGDESAAPAFYRLIRIGKKKLPSIRGTTRSLSPSSHDGRVLTAWVCRTQSVLGHHRRGDTRLRENPPPHCLRALHHAYPW